MGMTYVTIYDNANSDRVTGVTTVAFSVYNEARSFARFQSTRGVSGTFPYLMYVWNLSGNSGFYDDGVWTALENRNYP